MVSIVWLRRDLRLHDHAALATALAEKADVQPVFVFDSEILARFKNKDDRRLTFIAETLCQLDTQLRARGGKLLVLHGKAATLMPKLAKALGATAIFAAEDFEPATRERDEDVRKSVTPGVRFVQMLDHLIRAPQSTVKADGTPYKVFTPYYKVWRRDLGAPEYAEYTVKDKDRYANGETSRRAAEKAGIKVLHVHDGPAKLLKEIGYHYMKDKLWTVDDVQKRLKLFISKRLAQYPKARDELSVSGTSQLSPYLRHGLISVRECLAAAMGHGAAGEKWISELAWREFYATILYHFPEVVNEEFEPKYRGGAIPWSDDKKHIDAFTTGRTGYPVVDAAVRELITTGYMHNRARMIVASFVTKDLLLDWRIGEEFFAQHLMDYELASNNGGWQWGASTGVDASPYFRIFNPVLQSRKFDPKGDYIKAYVPELRGMTPKDIHAPWEAGLLQPKGYPQPVVDRAHVKERVVGLFRRAGQKA